MLPVDVLSAVTLTASWFIMVAVFSAFAGGTGSCFLAGSGGPGGPGSFFPGVKMFFLGNSGFLPSGLGGTGFLFGKAGLLASDGLLDVGRAGFFGSTGSGGDSMELGVGATEDGFFSADGVHIDIRRKT